MYSGCKTDQLLWQNVWHEVEYCLNVCRPTHGTHTEIAWGIKNLFKLLSVIVFSFCVAITSSPLNLCNRSHHL
jgi:hypothetical protein